MNLYSLLKQVGLSADFADAEVTGITDTAGNVQKGNIFVCIQGKKTDGHSFAAGALEKGACAVICERELTLEKTVTVRSTRLMLSFLCSAFYGNPGDNLKLIGITGTNGKTTTAEYIRHIINSCGKKCGIIGTLGIDYEGGTGDTSFTTPGGSELFGALRQMVDNGCEYCVMEVSSQALSQERAAALTFEVGVVTNIGSDHLDYHKTTDNYINAKLKLVSQCKQMLINADDEKCSLFASAAGEKTVRRYSAGLNYADYTARNIRISSAFGDYLFFDGTNVNRVKIPTPGMAGVYNSLAAAAACLQLGFNCNEVCAALETLPAVNGRAQMLESPKGFSVCIDYAHTPEALSGMLTALRGMCNGKIITVFGCGGERYKEKRPLMGAAAAELSDTVIVTEDNSRNERTEDIITDICAGIRKKHNLVCEPNRKKAIDLAIKSAKKNDIILIAGKGHEEYIISNGEKLPFSDIKAVKQAMAE